MSLLPGHHAQRPTAHEEPGVVLESDMWTSKQAGWNQIETWEEMQQLALRRWTC